MRQPCSIYFELASGDGTRSRPLGGGSGGCPPGGVGPSAGRSHGFCLAALDEPSDPWSGASPRPRCSIAWLGDQVDRSPGYSR
ncbi:hypothetical protein NDU88_001748 [Pleurodeles waltl]|uniref:Uncharacterized protein n=1 Tax=Pleurodeles waltl TaxID=8319 RepID=A0AAV7VCT6_PLEWA|nr:hypothetical protein NDU88_001748 [Pleurodeles waltl]